MQRELTSVGTYRRALGGSWARLLENALDWEHLPFLHASSFTSIECLDAGPWGWRAEVGIQPTGDIILLELLLERDERRWVSRTVDGTGAGAEIWSVATPTGERRCTVDVEFLLPDVRSATAHRLGAAYAELYTRLYDEDESMMIGRQEVLDRTCAGQRCPHLGGPLGEPGPDGIVQCPWHGYQFDVATGECVSGQPYRLRSQRSGG